MSDRPVVNPILNFLKSPTPKTVTGGGKNEKGIKSTDLISKKSYLSAAVKDIDRGDIDKTIFAGKTHIIAKMDEDSLSPSWTPTDLFDSRVGSRIVAPAYKGFLVEIDRSKLKELSNHIQSTRKIKDLVDISRIRSITPFDTNETLRGSTVDDTWENLPIDNGHKTFNIWLKPFKNLSSRNELAEKIKSTLSAVDCSLGHPDFEIRLQGADGPAGLEEELQKYVTTGEAAFSISISSKNDFLRILSSGAIYRIEPAPHIRTASAPGTGKEPTPAFISKSSPTVVIIDGGVSAQSYLPLQKLSVQKLVNDSDANLAHGNKVASLICHAHAWNNNRPLPNLECTFISAQAICKDTAPKAPNHRQLLKYLDQVATQTAEHSRVWNLSFNQIASRDSNDEVSYLGHEISKLARKYSILPIISAGNINHNPSNQRISPPADCEAALTVSGRTYDIKNGSLGEGCKFSLRGPAPAGMKKPDLSWFSELRMIGGAIDTGTSFSTPLVSSLAAHTFENMKGATPDLVRALLINRAELFAHSDSIGWGTPWSDNYLPWFCAPGHVTLAWSAKLQPGYNYYWSDISIPPELIQNGKFAGTVALTAILRPLTSGSVGENYFSSRLQTSLQATSNNGRTISLAGSMREDKENEAKARADLAKWNPIRNHIKTHKGTGISGTTMRLNARIFTRDLYQFDLNHHSELEPQEVSFVLTLSAPDNNSTVYDSTIRSMHSDLESAVLNYDIHVS